MDGGGLGALILPTPVISAYIENHGGERASEREKERMRVSKTQKEREKEKEKAREKERKR